MLLLIWMHFVADFLLQSDKMAVNKGKSAAWLWLHCLIYAAPFLIFGLLFACWVGATHFMIDYVSSRVNARLWSAGERHWFFSMIGLDQALHLTVLYVLAHDLGIAPWASL